MESSGLTKIQLNMAVNKNSNNLQTHCWNFISMQTKIGNFKGAKKTQEDLKMFSLHSMNSRDTIEAMEKSSH